MTEIRQDPGGRYVAALYCRLSPRPDGKYEGVDLQERWGRDYASSAWPDLPVEVFADKGISAANGDERPEYERFREWLAAGRVAHVWAVEQTRLERREIEWFRLAAELDAAGITDLHTDRDGIVRVRDEVAGIKSVLAAGEVRKMKRRVNDRLAENAAKGEPPGVRPFGYVHATTTEGVKTYEIVPEQADAIRYAADKVLDGWSLSNIAAELRGRGLTGAHGGKLTAGSVRSWLTSPSVAGHRVHSGRIVGSGNWEPILDEATYDAARHKLASNRVVRRRDGGTYPIDTDHQNGNPSGRKYVVTGGLAVCGVCGHALVGTLKQLRNKTSVRSVPYLLCSPTKGGKACVGVMLEPTEAYVINTLFDELDKPEFLAAIAADDHGDRRDELVAALGALERRRDELAELWAQPGELTAAEWRTARRALAEQEQRLRAELAAVPPPMVGMDIATVRSAWPDMTLDERREFLRLFVEKVVVNRAKPGTKGFDSGRVTVEWRPL